MASGAGGPAALLQCRRGACVLGPLVLEGARRRRRRKKEQAFEVTCSFPADLKPPSDACARSLETSLLMSVRALLSLLPLLYLHFISSTKTAGTHAELQEAAGLAELADCEWRDEIRAGDKHFIFF